MEFAPIIVFVYDRLDHVKETLQALSENDYAEKSKLFIFSDKYLGDKRNEKEVLEVREYISREFWQSKFESVEIVLAEEHKGLANSVIEGVTKIIKEYGKVIVVEDDLVTAKSFLRYMNEALDYYEKIDNVWSICGYTLVLNSVKKLKADVYAGYRGGSWGWATWHNRWEKVDWEVKDFNEFISSEEKMNEFNRGGDDLTKLLKKQMDGKCDSWAVRWNYQQYKENMITIFPVKSQVKNIGWDGSGKNCSKAILKIFDTIIEEFSSNIQFCRCEIDKNIMKETKKAYNESLIGRLSLVITRHIYSFFRKK